MPDPEPNLTPAARLARAERDARAAQALRENLRKRKQQARARDAETTADAAPTGDPAEDPTGDPTGDRVSMSARPTVPSRGDR